MGNLNIKKHLLFLFWLCLTGLQAQSTLSTAGGNVTGNGGSVSYSLGQMIYTHVGAVGGSMYSGIQQAYEITIVTEIGKSNSITLQCSVFPNPTTDLLNLRVEDYRLKQLSYQLYDLNGKLLEQNMLESIDTNIAFNNYPSTSYLLKVIHMDKVVKSFKIIKK